MPAPLPATVSFADTLAEHRLSLRRGRARTLQLNLGKLCNLACSHCHVNAGPGRKENMGRETIDKIFDWLDPTDIPIVDLTGGAPEMNTHFRYFVEKLRGGRKKRHIIDRCNLTILNEPGYEWLGEFLVEHEMEVVASMPCYQPENVNAQRGEGVFDSSILGLQKLNDLGYGKQENLKLHLVFNPVGAKLPPDQSELEADYKEQLLEHFGIVFDQLYTITNMPIARYASYLRRNNQLEEYMELLVQNFNPASVSHVMCRDTISVDYNGRVFDCDFNQMLDLPIGGGAQRYLWEIEEKSIVGENIVLGDHCYGCVAGAGSSCTGAVLD